jgi:hypothetical protein
MTAIRALLEGLIDYAGFAPPASLPMAAAVRNYAAYREGQHAWALGRFVVPVERLAEFETAALEYSPFRLSILAPPGLVPSVETRHSIDAIEIKVHSEADIVNSMKTMPKGVAAYFEISLPAPAEFIAIMAETRVNAKVRTGGLMPDLFPTSANLGHFFSICGRAKVPFKATAGLHHPIREKYKLTYEPDSPCGIMHGFLNVFLAAILLYWRGSETDAIRTLEERSLQAFRFDDAGVSWHGHHLKTEQIAEARKKFAIGFGSCSFEEPIAELRGLALLER